MTGVPCSKITLLFRQERDRQTDRQMDVGGTICNIDKSECSDICGCEVLQDTNTSPHRVVDHFHIWQEYYFGVGTWFQCMFYFHVYFSVFTCYWWLQIKSEKIYAAEDTATYIYYCNLRWYHCVCLKWPCTGTNAYLVQVRTRRRTCRL